MTIKTPYRILLSALLIFSILWPRINYAVTELFSGGFDTIVICNGEGLQRITVNSDGQPVSQDTVVLDKCVNVLAAVPFPSLDWTFERRLLVVDRVIARPAQRPATLHFNAAISPVRAPPVVFV